MRNKTQILFRIIVINWIVITIISMFNPYSHAGSINSIKDLLLITWIGFTVVGAFCLMIYMFYHWNISSFINQTTKMIWLIILLLGFPLYLLGPITYYYIVYEKKTGLYPSSVV